MQEFVLLVQAPFALPAVAVALRLRGLSAVHRRLLRESRRPVPPLREEERLPAAQRLAWCVQVSAAYGPWPANCLQRSVVLCWFLHRRGLTGELRIGVRRSDEGALDFHSWVEFDGNVINDAVDVRERYATFMPAEMPDAFRHGLTA